MATFSQRLVGAARLDGAIYEEVEADRGANGQAALVVLLASLATGVASGLGATALVTGTLVAVIGWIAWAALIYLIGTRLLPEPQTRADLGELLRTVAFAYAPALLRVVGVVPGLRWIAIVVTSVWILVAMIVAVRHALDFTSTARAVGVCLVGWLLATVMAVVIGVLFATPVS